VCRGACRCRQCVIALGRCSPAGRRDEVWRLAVGVSGGTVRIRVAANRLPGGAPPVRLARPARTARQRQGHRNPPRAPSGRRAPAPGQDPQLSWAGRRPGRAGLTCCLADPPPPGGGHGDGTSPATSTVSRSSRSSADLWSYEMQHVSAHCSGPFTPVRSGPALMGAPIAAGSTGALAERKPLPVTWGGGGA
jgi:hypothetical protein